MTDTVTPLKRPRGKRKRQLGLGSFMSVAELHEKWMPDRSLNYAYRIAQSGVFPFVRVGNSIDLIRAPTEALLSGKTAVRGDDLDRAIKLAQRLAQVLTELRDGLDLKPPVGD